jgi:hypothetical protein
MITDTFSNQIFYPNRFGGVEMLLNNHRFALYKFRVLKPSIIYNKGMFGITVFYTLLMCVT